MPVAKRPRPRSGKAALPATVLVGDIGGTSTRLALYPREPGGRALAEATLPSRDHASFEEAAGVFLGSLGAHAHPSAAALGIAGPVRRGVAVVTNLPWRLDERALARRLGIGQVRLHNDLVVAARGCLHVPASALVPLTAGVPVRKGQHLAVLAAGTGLGEARLIWDGARHLALATEGGHCDFAPRTPLEMELLGFLAARHPGHVSYERVVSGAGLGALYDFFVERRRGSEAPGEPEGVEARLASGDRNATVAELGLAGASPAAAQAVDLFVSLYGAEAGNMVLRELSLGGVYVVGNIGRTLLPARREVFLEGFRRKGRFSALLAEVPVALVTDPRVGLRGALAFAREPP